MVTNKTEVKCNKKIKKKIKKKTKQSLKIQVYIYIFSINWDLFLLSGALGSKSLSSAVKSVLVVSSELGVNTLEGRVLEGLGLLDTVAVSLLDLVVVGVVLRLGHF